MEKRFRVSIKEDNLAKTYPEFPFQFILFPKFQNYRLNGFNNLRIFWKFSKEISVRF